MPITQDQWHTTRSAVDVAGRRFTELVAASDAATMATKDWSVADTAAHVAGIARAYTRMVRFEDRAMPAIHDRFLATNVDTVSELNEQVLALDREREPTTLVAQLNADLDDLLRATEDIDPAAPVTWLGDSRVPICGVLAHLVNELHIHGWDIARAGRMPWPIPPADAALFFDAFFVELVRHGVGNLLDTDERPRDRRIAVEFRSGYTTPVSLVLHNGVVSAEEPGGGRDVLISFDPPALNLMLFHRIGKLRAAATGKVVVRGRRPWLLPTFLRTVRCP